MLPADLKGLYEAYSEVYEKDDLITNDLIEEVVEELIQECVEFGYEFEEAADIVEDAAIEYLMELNPYAPAGSKEARAYQKSTTATKRGVERRAAVTAAKEKVKAKAKGAVAAAGIAGSIAKDELRRVGRAAAHTVTHNVQKKKAEVKSGVKSLLGKGLRKAAGAVGKVASKAAGAASRLGEEVLDEDSRRMSNKQRTANVRQNIKAFGSNFTPPNNYDPDANRGKGEVLTRKQIEKKRRKALRQEEAELDIFDTILEFLVAEDFAETNQEALELMAYLDEELVGEIIDEARRADKEGHERGTAANPSRKDVHHGDPSQRSMLHSKLKRRADEMGRARRNSPRYKQGGRPPLSRKEKAFLQASDRTRRSIRNPNVPDTGRHQNVGRYDREDQQNPKRNPKHDANK